MVWQCNFSSVWQNLENSVGKQTSERKFICPPNNKLQKMTISWFKVIGHITKAYLLMVPICGKNNVKEGYCTFSFQNVHNICWSRLNMISDSIMLRNGVHPSYTYHFLFKDNIFFFLHSTAITTNFWPTPYL